MLPQVLREAASKKRVLNYQISKSTPMLHVFAVEDLAIALDCSGYDKRIVPGELIASRQIQRTNE